MASLMAAAGSYVCRHSARSRDLVQHPSAIAVIEAFDAPGDHWEKALRYCAAGNLQAVVVEFFAVLAESRGYDRLEYSHAVTHWNLPPNPVDLEQREGRVHRYKGHAVRKNVARAVVFPTDADRPPWEQLFDAAANGDRVGAGAGAGASDMVPFWVYAPEQLNGELARIERRLPLTPFTRDASIIGTLRSSVAHYRLAFGQPRQEELVATLAEEADDELRAALQDVRVDLSPPRRRPPPHSGSNGLSSSVDKR